MKKLLIITLLSMTASIALADYNLRLTNELQNVPVIIRINDAVEADAHHPADVGNLRQGDQTFAFQSIQPGATTAITIPTEQNPPASRTYIIEMLFAQQPEGSLQQMYNMLSIYRDGTTHYTVPSLTLTQASAAEIQAGLEAALDFNVPQAPVQHGIHEILEPSPSEPQQFVIPDEEIKIVPQQRNPFGGDGA